MRRRFFFWICFFISCNIKEQTVPESINSKQSQNCFFKTGWYLVDYARKKGCEKKAITDTSSYFLVNTPLITSDNIVKVEGMKFTDDTPGFIVSFDTNGTKTWENITKNHVGDLFAVVLNDTLLTVSLNASRISTGKAFFPLFNLSSAELERIKHALLRK